MSHRLLSSTVVLMLLSLLGSTMSIANERDTPTKTEQLLLNASAAATWNIDRYVAETQLSLSELYSTSGDTKTAERWLTRALSNTNSSIDSKFRSKIFARAAKGYFNLGKKSDADRLLKKSLQEAKMIHKDFDKEMAYWGITQNLAVMDYSPDQIVTAIENNNSSLKAQSGAFSYVALAYFQEKNQKNALVVIDRWLLHINKLESKKREEYILDIADTLIVWGREYSQALSLLSRVKSKSQRTFVKIKLMSLARNAIRHNENHIASKALLDAVQLLQAEKLLPNYLNYAEIAYLQAKAGNTSAANKLISLSERSLKDSIKHNIASPHLQAMTYQWLSNAHKILRMQKTSWGYTSTALMLLNKIPSVPEKDKAIASLATIRAEISGDSAQAAELLDRISDTNIKDDALGSVAMIIAKNNLLNEAAMLIDKIKDDKNRDSSYGTLVQLRYMKTIDYVVEKGRNQLTPGLLSNAVKTANKIGKPDARASQLILIAQKSLALGNNTLASDIIDSVVTIINQEKNAYRKASRLIDISRAIIEKDAQLSEKSARTLQPLAKLYSPANETATALFEKGDKQGARDLFFKTAEGGDRYAQHIIANAYSNGWFGLQRSAEKYRHWMGLSASNGFAAAQYEMGRLAMGRDDKSSADLLWKAADQGNHQAQYTLIILATEKAETITDSVHKRAEAWASEDNAQIQDWLGTTYYQGKKLKKSYNKAARWFRKAAVAGNTHSQSSIGVMMYLGQGTKKDTQRGRYWLDIAAKKNYEPAINFLEQINKLQKKAN